MVSANGPACQRPGRPGGHAGPSARTSGQCRWHARPWPGLASVSGPAPLFPLRPSSRHPGVHGGSKAPSVVAASKHEAVSFLSLSAPMAEATGMSRKVVIIGAGIAGVTAAVALARKGLDAEIYEQAPELKEVGAGVGLWGNAFRALRAIGLADGVMRLAGEAAGSGIKRPDGGWLLYQPYEIMQKRWGAGFASVHRAELHRLLAGQLDPSAVHLDARCTGICDAGNVGPMRASSTDGEVSELRCTRCDPVARRWCSRRPLALRRGCTGCRPVAPERRCSRRPACAGAVSR